MDYLDKKGRRLFVASGEAIFPDCRWYSTFFRNRKGVVLRCWDLRIQETREEAQADLDRYARRHGLRRVA